MEEVQKEVKVEEHKEEKKEGEKAEGAVAAALIFLEDKVEVDN